MLAQQVLKSIEDGLLVVDEQDALHGSASDSAGLRKSLAVRCATFAEVAHAVLIVEDERIVAKDLQQTLDGMGYEAYAIASSGDEAVARATERCPDIILMDIRIKGSRDGIETAAILRSQFDVPLVYLTAHADDTTIERAKQTEPYGYLLKPVKAAELRSAIEVALYRHAMERRLRERERWYATTLRSIADAVVSVDVRGHITFMNPAAEKLTGTTLAEAAGKPASDVVRVGDDRIISDTESPVVDEGRVLGAVMVMRDITEKTLMQRRIELSDRLASLGTMASGVAQEVNTPLSVVGVNAAYALDELRRITNELRAIEHPGTAAACRSLDAVIEAQVDVRAAAGQLGRLIAELRAFAKPPASRRVGDISIAHAIEVAVRSTAHEFRGRARVLSDVTVGLPVVRGDETRLVQVLIHVLSNAARAISPGDPAANHVTVRAFASPRDDVAIEVIDTGCGMSADTAARAFEPFFTTKAPGSGAGLGLAICRGIVASLGGEMTIDSAPGRGTTVRVQLPQTPQQAPAPAVTVPAARTLHGRILIIDDQEVLRRSMQRVLRGHQTTCAATGREALDLIAGGDEFDLILTDVMMPGMSGIQLYEALLSRDPGHASRMVFVSGTTSSPKVDDFLRSIPNRRLDKPFDVGSLRELIQELLAEQQVSDT
jgi:signal transduction histidine kinase